MTNIYLFQFLNNFWSFFCYPFFVSVYAGLEMVLSRHAGPCRVSRPTAGTGGPLNRSTWSSKNLRKMARLVRAFL